MSNFLQKRLKELEKKIANIGEEQIEEKYFINVGACLDIPNGRIVRGNKGEHIIVGGIPGTLSFSGPGNSYKTMISLYTIFSAMNRIFSTHLATLNIFDTEINYIIDRLKQLLWQFEYLPEDIFNPEYKIAEVYDKSKLTAEEWEKKLFKVLEERSKNDKAKVEYNAFKDRYGKVLKDFLPIFVLIDSLTEYMNTDAEDALSKEDANSGARNMVHARSAKYKSELLSKIPKFTTKANGRFVFTAHIGSAMSADTNKWNQPRKQLAFMRQDEKMKGVGSKFSFLTMGGWINDKSKDFVDNNKCPYYPANDIESVIPSRDLQIITLVPARNKGGGSGDYIEIVASQRLGVLPDITEFRYIYTRDMYGIEGRPQSMNMKIYPDVKFTRKTLRRLTQMDKKLRRAINITSELLQIKNTWPHLISDGTFMDIDELYEKIKEQGYDWNEILETREWWAIDQYNKDIPPFCSVIDLLYMAKGEYKPYWKKG